MPRSSGRIRLVAACTRRVWRNTELLSSACRGGVSAWTGFTELTSRSNARAVTSVRSKTPRICSSKVHLIRSRRRTIRIPGEHFFVIREVRRPDPFLGILIGDALHNLRSALDHLAFQLVAFPAVPGGPKADEDKRAFPICSHSKFWPAAKEKIRGASPGVEAIVERLQPYNGGQTLLWSLHELNNWDKHRLLHLAGNHLYGSGFLNPELVESSEFRPAGPFEAGAEIARYKLRPSLEPEVDVGFYMSTGITFEQGPGAGRIVRNLLGELVGLVVSIRSELSPYVAP
jgi:hypothetical protein